MMNLITLNFLLVEFLIRFPFCNGGENYGQINLDNNNPYSFHMFENFDLTGQVFAKEQILVQDLKELRDLLVRRENRVKSILNLLDLGRIEKGSSYSDLPIDAYNLIMNDTMARNVDKIYFQITEAQYKELMQRINLTTQNFPNKTDFIGALNGMVLLHDTYAFNLTSLGDGKIDIPHLPNGQAVSLSSPHHIPSTDVLDFAKVSYQRTWYDNAIHFLKRYIDIEEKVNVTLKEEVKLMRKNLVKLNNQYLLKKKVMADENFKVLSYTINSHLRMKAKQPKALYDPSDPLELANFKSSQGKENFFRMVCRGFTMRHYGLFHVQRPVKSVYLHHNDPYLKLGPFKAEILSEDPFIMVFHEIFTEQEMEHMVETSRPNLSRNRYVLNENNGQKHEFKEGKKRRIVSKSVQHWIQDVNYHDISSDIMYYHSNNSRSITDEILFKLSKKLELATTLKITSKFGSTKYQVTNYGLAGLCETHVDPHGYIEGRVELPQSRMGLKMSGDMFGTIMGWIKDEPVGGSTAFIHPGKEVVVSPRKGSAAFWFSLDRKGHRDKRTVHGGCPVIKGSKWIVNKWIYFFDQFDRYPCSLHPQQYYPSFKGHY